MNWENYLMQFQPDVLTAFVAGVTVGVFTRSSVRFLAAVAVLWVMFKVTIGDGVL